MAVREYINEDRANSERDKLGASTGLPARVVTFTDGGSESYRVVLGAFPDRTTANRAASDLIRKGLVGEARTVPLPKTASTPSH